MSINLSKGQKISLTKESGTTLEKIIMGLGWDVAQKSSGFMGRLFGGGAPASIDLDASCVLFDENKNVLDTVWFRQLKSKDGSIVHTGDNVTGEGEGDDEQIIVDLSKVPQNVKFIVFGVNSFRGQTFSQVENAFCRIVDAKNDKEIARYDLSCRGNHTGMIMSKIYLHEGEWKMHAIGENSNGNTIDALVPLMKNFI